MHNIGVVFKFGWVYLRRYWVRVAAGVLLGVIFGLTNASFVWATKTLIERFRSGGEVAQVAAATPEQTATPLSEPPVGGAKGFFSTALSGLKRSAIAVKDTLSRGLDQWLPRFGRPLDWRQITGILLFLPVLVSIRGTTDYLSAYCMGWASERMINDMRMDVLRKLSSLSMDFFTKATSGDLLTRVNTDTQRLLRCLRSGGADLIKEGISLVSVIAVLIAINWQLTLFALILLPACMVPLFILARKVRQAARGSVKGEVLQSSQLVELLASIRIIKAYNLESSQLQRYRDVSDGMVRRNMRGLKARELVSPLIEVISMFGISLLILFVIQTETSISDFAGFLVGMILFFGPVKKLAAVHMQFEQASPGVTRLGKMLSLSPSVREPANPKPLTQFTSDIQFDNVTFSYGDRQIIRDFNLVIPRGGRVGIAGPSGSGKSTLVNLLFRFYDPQSGSVRIDGTDLREVSSRDLRQLLALVSQDIIIFDQTVAENIACGREGATQADIEQAARAAYAHEFIMQLPKGYQSRLGERGAFLSGGQRQRIAIARAFIRNAPILVLDEATGSLDSHAEGEVQRAIDHISENRTVICVAHRLSTLSSCDQVVVLVDGQTVEQGSYSALLRAGGIFSVMAQRQGITASTEDTSRDQPGTHQIPVKGHRNGIATERTALASFPRSGNTWLRFLIENATGARSGSVYTDRILPRNVEGIVIKTHELDSADYARAIHVVRHPLDAIESFYHWRKDIAKQSDVVWHSHVHEAAERWRLHTEHWLACHAPVYRLRYEDLHAAPETELRSLLDWMGHSDLTDDDIRAAVAGSSIEKMRELDPKLGPSFFRRGRVGASDSAFSAEQREAVTALLRPYLEQFGYLPEPKNMP